MAVAVRRALLAGSPGAVRARRAVGARVVARPGRLAVAVGPAALLERGGPALVAARSAAGLAAFRRDGDSARRDAVRATVVTPHRRPRPRCRSRHRRFWAERRTASQGGQDHHGEDGSDSGRFENEGG